MTSATLLFDIGPGSGLGHRSRMTALARELRSRGVDGTLRPGADRASDDIVIVDSYVHRADDRRRFAARLIVAIDDLFRDLAVDLVVDPNPGRTAGDHPSAERVLVGPRYALLPSMLAPSRTVDGAVHTILVTTGATDDAGLGCRLAAALVDATPTACVRLVLGPWGASHIPSRVSAVMAPDSLDDELAGADLVVTAGGVTMLEALRRGRPTVALVLAENQRDAVEGAAREGALIAATESSVVQEVTALAGDMVRRSALSACAQSYVDGKGAARVAEEIIGRA